MEQLGLLLDAGDGVCAGLLQKSRKVHKVAITHPDRDHVTGILQLQQLNAQNGVPEIFYPADCGSFPALAEFCRNFDPGRGDQVTWSPVKPGDDRDLGGGCRLKVMANDHFHDQPGQIKSVSYVVAKKNRKLKAEFVGLAGNELAELSRQHGSDHLTTGIEEKVLGYAGDTSVSAASRWAGCRILIHEATFLKAADAGDRAGRHLHSYLDEVLRMASEVKPQYLILNHFSSRYTHEEIVTAIRREASGLRLPFPVFAILPGEIARDILTSPPVWPGLSA
ncbi:MAG TPA: MBL fold metallo-hydrolase [Candidatus Sulfotelmatobacter sp.]|nr:MBL fold metallo-hydrolase [Candidatus Sulfotelmatobacter sp.]